MLGIPALLWPQDQPFSVTALKPINREMNACMDERMDEREIDCFVLQFHHTVISLIYGKLGVYFLYERMCVCGCM